MLINNFLKNITKYLNLGKEICIFPVYGCKFCCYSGMLHRHGYYSRNVITKYSINRINVFRIKCPSCNKTHAILPSFLIPYYQYSLEFIFECLYLSFVVKDSYSKIADYFNSLNPGLSFNISNIYSFRKRMKENLSFQRFISGANISARKLEVKDRKAFEFEFPNECWQSDISVRPYLNINSKKRKTHIVAILDDSSKLIIHAEAFFSDNFLSLLSVFKKAVAKRGIPKKLFVDNGKVYKSNQMQFICANLGTIISFARPYSPESKGKIERWFKTLQDQWMNVINWNDFSSLEELNSSLFRYIEEDYNSKVHSAINMKPIDKFIQHIDLIKFIPNKQEIDYIFLYRVARRLKRIQLYLYRIYFLKSR